jgi:hypothetical protein
LALSGFSISNVQQARAGRAALMNGHQHGVKFCAAGDL